ncbi:Hypothetical_protein [Hexamita inflata]|uniref:Hypothetical_protein n=1 Tax=Hexamita inflata TaxID=28002 RepID=A0AA86P3W3_9EUKA|nr:Hypothetical protein HINF_LOCUS17861 [Hexamita inflata]CAI9940542.1 Hypothetical protein HINF_LOCUS28187 [Hexamita inflata]CAI9940547.1 Hypothetical protein HINF_LOCUS28192 [Hexamita inflata]
MTFKRPQQADMQYRKSSQNLLNLSTKNVSCEFSQLSEVVETDQQCYSDTYELEADDKIQRDRLQITLTLGDIKKLIKANKEQFQYYLKQVSQLQQNLNSLQNEISFFEIKVFKSFKLIKQM